MGRGSPVSTSHPRCSGHWGSSCCQTRPCDLELPPQNHLSLPTATPVGSHPPSVSPSAQVASTAQWPVDSAPSTPPGSRSRKVKAARNPATPPHDVDFGRLIPCLLLLAALAVGSPLTQNQKTQVHGSEPHATPRCQGAWCTHVCGRHPHATAFSALSGVQGPLV